MDLSVVFYLTFTLLLFITILYLDYSKIYTKQFTRKDKENISKLIRQTARWATAAEQDKNPYIKNLHATYSMGYLMAMRELYSDEILYRHSGIDILTLDKKINGVMDSALREIALICPDGQPKDEFLAYLAGQGNLLE